MQKMILSFLFLFLLFGMMLHFPLILADEDDDSTDNSGSSDDDSASDSNDDDEDEETETEIRLNGERIKERIKTKDGKIIREVKGRFIDENGNVVKFERKIVIKNGEVKIETKLKVEGEGSNLSVEDSEGRKHRVRVTPERLRALMLERLNANNISDFSLEEIKHKNIPRVVYKINSEHPGRFLGIFKIALRAETQVDSETGEILAINGPWWAFLVAEQLPDEDEIIGNETLAEEVVASDDELEDEFEDVEVEDDIETEVEVSGNIELSEETQATLNSLISSFEGQEEKVELKLKVKKDNGETEVEQEIKEGTLTDEQQQLWNSLIEQVQVLVENAEGDDIEIEIEIEYELELESDEEAEDELEEEENETENEDEEENESETSVTGEVVETQKVEPIVLN